MTRIFVHTATIAIQFLIATAAVAGSSDNGKVIALWPTTGNFSFDVSGARLSMPSCHTAPVSRWVIDLSTPAGQALASSVITAFAGNFALEVYGAGTCNTQSDTETVALMKVLK